MKQLTFILLALLCVCVLGGCQTLELLDQVQAEREGTGLPTKPAGDMSDSKEQQEALTVRGGEEVLGASFADILDRHDGNRNLYFSDSAGFYYLAEESCIQYSLVDPLERNGTYEYHYPPDYLDMAEDPYGSFHYDFENGEYSPSDFMVTSFHVWGDALTALFEGEEMITPQRLNQIFDTVRYAHWSWGEEGMIRYHMGPYRAGNCHMDFSLDDSQEYVVSARVSAEMGTYSYKMYSGGIEPGTDIIQLTQVPPEGVEIGSGNRYPMTRELRASLEANPPISGVRYYAVFNENGQVAELISTGQTTGHTIDRAVLDALSQAMDAGSLNDMYEMDFAYESAEALTDQYFWPARRLGLDGQTWTSPEQLDPETLLNCYEFYDFELGYLAEYHPEIDFNDMAMDGREFWVPQEVVEESIRKFVPVPAERLQASYRYSAEKQAYRMVLMFGKGDSLWGELTRAWWTGNILLLEVVTDGDTDYLLLDRGGDDPHYLATVHVPLDG